MMLYIKIGGKSSGKAFYIISSGGQTTYSINGIALFRKSGGLYASVRTTSRLWKLASFYTVEPDVWYHVAITWEETSGLFAYINGQYQGNNTYPRPGTFQDNYKELHIGKPNSGSVYYEKFCLDELYIFSEIKSPAFFSQTFQIYGEWNQNILCFTILCLCIWAI